MKKMKRKALVLLSTMAMVLVVGSGVALAATTIHCPNVSSGGSPSTALYCNGTTAADTMYGSDLYDVMLGKGGADTMHGNGSTDYLEGNNGSDHLYGDAGGDNLWGGVIDNSATPTYTDASDDYVHGGVGDDTLWGGYAQSGVDRIYGEGGNDTIDASQRKNPDPAAFQVTKEIIDCGAGASDVVYFDKGLDVVATNCETKHPYS